MTEAEKVSLREFIEQKIAAERELREAKFASVEELAEKHNNLLQMIESERGHYVTVELYNQRHEDIEHRLAELSDQIVEARGRNTGITTSVGWIIAGIGVAIAVVALLIGRV